MDRFIAHYETEEELQAVLNNLDEMPEDFFLDGRVFAKVPKAKFNKCPKDLGDARQAMDGDLNNFYRGYEDEESVYTVLGSTMKSLKGKPTGGYNKPFDKATMKKWLKELGVEAFTLKQPEVDKNANIKKK